jgi:hypothetical protein
MNLNNFALEPRGPGELLPQGGTGAVAEKGIAVNEKYLERWLAVSRQYLMADSGTEVEDETADHGPGASQRRIRGAASRRRSNETERPWD